MMSKPHQLSTRDEIMYCNAVRYVERILIVFRSAIISSNNISNISLNKNCYEKIERNRKKIRVLNRYMCELEWNKIFILKIYDLWRADWEVN